MCWVRVDLYTAGDETTLQIFGSACTPRGVSILRIPLVNSVAIGGAWVSTDIVRSTEGDSAIKGFATKYSNSIVLHCHMY